MIGRLVFIRTIIYGLHRSIIILLIESYPLPFHPPVVVDSQLLHRASSASFMSLNKLRYSLPSFNAFPIFLYDVMLGRTESIHH